MPPLNLSCPLCGCEHFNAVLGARTLTLVCTACLWSDHLSLLDRQIDLLIEWFEPGGG